MTAPKFTVSMLCFNHLALTKKCIESVLKHSGADTELIITNNGSTDGTTEYLNKVTKGTLANLRVIHNKENEGFQKPNENALTLAQGEYFILLNNDIEVCVNWLSDLVKPMEENHKIAITGIEGTLCRVDAKLNAFPGPTPEYIEGSVLMVPVALVRKHGLFSPYLKFIYCEDTDLSFRMREQGYQIKTVKVKIAHNHPSSTTKHMDLREVLAHNKDAMVKRWGFYLKRKEMARRILVRRLGARGDVLLITPVLRALRTKYPLAEIHVETMHPEMLKGFPDVRMATNKHTYFDTVYDLVLAYEKRPEVHIVQAYADAAKVELPRNWKLEMFPSDADLEWGLRKSRGRNVALIHGGVTTWPGKNWPVYRMAKVVDALKGMGYFTVAVGSLDSSNCDCDVSICGQATPQQFYALATHAKLFVGLDSMPQHVASAANTPSVVLFGPTNPKAIVRPTPSIISVQADVNLVPCVGEHGRRKIPVTSAPCSSECINAITVEMVMDAIRKLQARFPK